jgi:hypothetical protein
MKRKTRKEIKQEILESKDDNIFLQKSYRKLSKKYDKLDMRYKFVFTKSKEWYIKLVNVEKQNAYLKKKIWQLKHKLLITSSYQAGMMTRPIGTVQSPQYYPFFAWGHANNHAWGECWPLILASFCDIIFPICLYPYQ